MTEMRAGEVSVGGPERGSGSMAEFSMFTTVTLLLLSKFLFLFPKLNALPFGSDETEAAVV
jgi:hypothetical protein